MEKLSNEKRDMMTQFKGKAPSKQLGAGTVWEFSRWKLPGLWELKIYSKIKVSR